MENPDLNEIRELMNKAEAAFQGGDRRSAGILVDQALKKDFTSLATWQLLQKLMGNNQSLETFQIEFTKKYYPDKLYLLEKPSQPPHPVNHQISDEQSSTTATCTACRKNQVVRPSPAPAQNKNRTPTQPKQMKKRNAWLIPVLTILTLASVCFLLSNITLLVVPSLQGQLVSYGYSKNVTIISIAAAVVGLFFLIGMWTRKRWATYGFIGTTIIFPIAIIGMMFLNYPGDGLLPIEFFPAPTLTGGGSGKIVYLSTPTSINDRATTGDFLVSYEIMMMNVDGSNQTRLANVQLPTMFFADPFSISPDGQKIAYISLENSSASVGIYVMNIDGSGQVRITEISDILDYAWSPDGQKIVFSTLRDRIGDIYVINVDGSNQIHLTKNFQGAIMYLAWSPDGQKIAFSPDGRNQNIYLINIDGSDLTPITPGFSPAWSPNGQKIAYWCSPDNYSGEICVMNADGSNQAILTNNKWEYLGLSPAWSPDGEKIAFVAAIEADKSINGYVINANGNNQIQLTNKPLYCASLVWSPDGKYIAFTAIYIIENMSIEDVHHQIYLMNADGSGQTQLTNANEGDIVWPIWVP